MRIVFDPNNKEDTKVIQTVLDHLLGNKPTKAPPSVDPIQEEAEPKYLDIEIPPIRRPRKKRKSHRRWTDDERQFLREHAGRWSALTIAKHLGRSVPAVRTQAALMGLSLLKRRKYLYSVGENPTG